MITIKFSHHYLKMTSMVNRDTYLVGVSMSDIETLPAEFLKYDTAYINDKIVVDHYPLPKKGKYIVITLFTDGTVWTTIRRAMPHKVSYYVSHIGEQVNIEEVKE